ncbi:HAMP domain-containing histidine kinase [Helicobacter sp. MIT 05-5294]|nr:HAMP domain-containing histidine kinase [Helicobacter sp. MIT 05-5294]
MAIFSSALYSYLYFNTYGQIKHSLQNQFHHIIKNNINYNIGQSFYIQSPNPMQREVWLVEVLDTPTKQSFYSESESERGFYYSLISPYKTNKTLKITKDITKETLFLDSLLKGIILVIFFALILTQLFALAFSNILYKPIQNLSTTLSKLKEHDLEFLNSEGLPLEFHPLVLSINNLLERIKSYFGGQKQLFIGIAHELKTPLAVIKTKCEVTLIKEREKEVYIKALKENIQSINEMNAIIKTLLDLGRQESAQFEKSSLVDVNKTLQNIADNFQILSKKENKQFTYKLETDELLITIKPTLLAQIVQNFLQNAFKFTPQGKSILLTSQIINQEILRIVVIDEGCGIDSELEDIYAPFKRSGNKSGAGLGLFLAKNAANALGGSISLQNRLDTNGTIATFELRIAN